MSDCPIRTTGINPAPAGLGGAGCRGDRPVAPAITPAAGFTLLEVLVAMAILALCVVPLLGAITQALQATSRIERITTATELARNKLVQIELEKMPDLEETRQDQFGPPHQDFGWRVEYLKPAELQLLEDNLKGLKTMEVHLSVTWVEGGAEQAVDFSTLLVQ
jgi:type II secretion system protein I